MKIINCLIAVILLVMPLSSAYDVGGSFGINVQVDDPDIDYEEDPPEDPDIDVEIYYHSYVESLNSEREDNYAYPGEEVHFEVYVQHDDIVEDVILSIEDEEIECNEKNSKLDDGDDLGDEFSDNIEYGEEFMDYYKCSFIVDDLGGDVEVEIIALEDEDSLEKETEDWYFNPSLAIEVTGTSNVVVENKNGVSLDIKQVCGNSVTSIDPNERDTVKLQNCNKDNYIIGIVN